MTTFMSWPPPSPSSTTTATALRRTGRVVGVGQCHVPCYGQSAACFPALEGHCHTSCCCRASGRTEGGRHSLCRHLPRSRNVEQRVLSNQTAGNVRAGQSAGLGGAGEGPSVPWGGCGQMRFPGEGAVSCSEQPFQLL